MKHLTNKFRICLPIGAEVGISHLRAKTLKNTPCLFVCLRAYDSGVLRHKKVLRCSKHTLQFNRH